MTSDDMPATSQPPTKKSRFSMLGVDGRKLGSLATLILCGLVAGAIVAAAAFPAVGIAALTSKTAADAFQHLPTNLSAAPIPQTTHLLTSNGAHMTSFYEEHRVYMKLAEIPKLMQDAMVASEDQRFYHHRGVDPAGILRALVANKQAGEVQQGASTLTQQFVKNMLQYSAKNAEERRAATAPTTGRKIREIRYAIALEKKLNKKEILERYLNIAYFGNQAYGIAAAAQAYFSKQPKDLTIAEAALLAGLVKAPSKFDPNGEREEQRRDSKQRRNYVLDRMVIQHFLSKKDAEIAKKEEITLNPRPEPRMCENSPNREAYGFSCGFFLEWWKENPEFGKTRLERELNLQRGGYRIVSSFNPAMYDAAQRAVDEQISRNNPYALGMVIVEPGTGRVPAMAINRTYSIEDNPNGQKWPNTTNPLLTGTNVSAGYQAGSTFKMFTMVAAIEKGIPLNIKIYAPQKYTSKFLGDPGPAGCGRGSYIAYCPSNAGAYMSGTHTMYSGFGVSVNTFFVQLEERATVAAAIDVAERMGIPLRGELDQEQKKAAQADDRMWGAFTLGVSQVTPLDMANAYATLAARGKHCDPLPLLRITGPNGEPLPYAKPKCKQVIAPDVADAANDAARCPTGGKAFGCGSAITAGSVAPALGRPVAGKTGTTDNNNAAWFVGYTPNLAAAVVKVNPDAPNTNVGDTIAPIRAFNSAMKESLQGLPPEDFVAPTQGRINGIKETVPKVDGTDRDNAKRIIENAGFKVRIDADRVDSAQPEGRVAYTSPPGGEQAVKGSIVTMFLSTGKKPQPSPSQSVPAQPAAYVRTNRQLWEIVGLLTRK